MNQYTDLQIIECNRLHSEEAKANNNENFSLWTNNLQDIVHLDPGDKVSVHGAMISERGAGQSSSIEIKGQTLGFKQSFSYVNLSYTNASDDLPTGYEVIKAIPTTQEIEVRDDTAHFKISYYINANCHNYIHLPRRWWWVPSRTTENFSSNDDRSNFGMALSDPFATDDYALYDDFYQLTGIKGWGETAVGRSGYLSKPKNDNSRYTIMVRDATYYSEESASGNLEVSPGFRDPENAIYYQYEELKKVEIEPGFNSPEFISEEFTRQLQKINERKTRFKRSATDLTDNPERPGHPIPMYQEFNAECYKAFNVASIYPNLGDTGTNNPAVYFNYYINASNEDNASGFEYLQNYHIVACKRPELYTTGRLVNRDFNGDYLGIVGTGLKARYDGTKRFGTIGLSIDTEYTKENVEYWHDFILAQEKYPEVFKIFTDTRTPYNGTGDTIDTCRYCHINRYSNASMTIEGSYQLGHGGYLRPTWNTNASANFNSILLPFQYDSSQKDIFYENPEEGRNQKSYGCFGKNASGYIVIYPTEDNGSGSNLFLKLSDGSPGLYIEEDRRIGYDMHFSAPGNTWILPYSGISQKPSNYDTRASIQTTYQLARNSDTTLLQTYNYTLATNFFRGKLYIGADAPKLNWDGTNFAISDFHTAMNRGNEQSYEADWVDDVQDRDPQADDIVFKINPVEQYGDWTPARMPYVRARTYVVQSGGTDKNAQSPIINMNYEPWTIYDSLCGINIEDFGLTENQWDGCLWDLLGFSYKQFHSSTNNRLQRIDTNNRNDLSVITTNAIVPEGETKFFSQNLYGVPLYNNMLQRTGILKDKHNVYQVAYYPPIVVKTSSIQIVADKLPTRMIRGYYTIRSNLLSETPFIGGKINNTTMPIIGIVDKINGDGDFYFGQESSLQFTVTKPLKLASLTCSIHDPDGSYANTSEQNTVLFKIEKNKNITFNVLQQILEENKGNVPPRL
jgi:hypothetical protein